MKRGIHVQAALLCAAVVLLNSTLLAQERAVPSIDAVIDGISLSQLQGDLRLVGRLDGTTAITHAKHWEAIFKKRLKATTEWHGDGEGRPVLLEISLGAARRTSEDVLVVVPLHGKSEAAVPIATLLQMAISLSQVKPPSNASVLEREVRLFLEIRPGGMLEWIQASDWQTEEALLAIRLNEATGDSPHVQVRPLHRSHGFHYLGGWLAALSKSDGKVTIQSRLPSVGFDPFGTHCGFALMDLQCITTSPMTSKSLNHAAKVIIHAILRIAMVDDERLLAVQADAEGAASVLLAKAYQDALEYLLKSGKKSPSQLRVAFDHVDYTAKDLSAGLMHLQELARSNKTREMSHGGSQQLLASAQRYRGRLLRTARGLGGEQPLTMPLSAAESHAAGVIGYPNDRPGEAMAGRRRFLSAPQTSQKAALILDLVDGKRSAWHIFESLRIRRVIQGAQERVSLKEVLRVLEGAKSAGVLMDGALR